MLDSDVNMVVNSSHAGGRTVKIRSGWSAYVLFQFTQSAYNCQAKRDTISSDQRFSQIAGQVEAWTGLTFSIRVDALKAEGVQI